MFELNWPFEYQEIHEKKQIIKRDRWNLSYYRNVRENLSFGIDVSTFKDQ